MNVNPALMQDVRALIVEDDTDARKMLLEFASMLGAQVRGAANAEEALVGAADFDPTVAIIDLGLPGADGCQVARLLRDACSARVRLVALTGSVDARPQAMAAGFDEFVLKPLEAGLLGRLLKRERCVRS